MDCSTKLEVKRNYELDFLKLIFALFVFWTHITQYLNEKLYETLPVQFASISVHFFFIVSGMMMANSIVKHNAGTLSDTHSAGKSAIEFVIKKYKSIGWQFVVASIICVCVSNYKESFPTAIKQLLWGFPEITMISSSGVWLFNNGPTWYLSAMFICMLPIAYLLYKNRDFALYVFAPVTAVVTYGYMCKANNWVLVAQSEFQGFVMGSFIRAACGLCFGICAWTIYSRIKNGNTNKRMRVLLTITEIVLYFTFFAVWFLLKSNPTLIAVAITLPIAIAITFSGKSYVNNLFRFKWMGCFGPLSLTIYLNHRAAIKLVLKIYTERSFKFRLCAAILLTIVFCILNLLIVSVGKKLWKNKLKPFFTKPDVS